MVCVSSMENEGNYSNSFGHPTIQYINVNVIARGSWPLQQAQQSVVNRCRLDDIRMARDP